MNTSHSTNPPVLIAVGSWTVTRLNQRSADFWREQTELRDARIKDEAVLAIAMTDLESNARRGVPISWQKSFEQALADAVYVKSVVRRQFGREGGKSRKADALQQIIERLVQRDPKLSERGLYYALRREMSGGTITRVDPESAGAQGGEICFVSGDGKAKSAPLSGLKDRLSRAKKLARTR